SITKNYDLMRDGALEADVAYVIEMDGQIVLSSNGKGALNYRYFGIDYNLYKSFRAWLTETVNERTEVVSNIVSFIPVASNDASILSLGPNYTVSRNGEIGDDLFWVVDSDGVILLDVSAADSLIYRYPNNQPGKDYRIWLKDNPNNSDTVVSNIISYTIDSSGTALYTLSIDEFYKITRSSGTSTALTWVIEKNGEVVLKRNVLNEIEYTYYANTSSDYFRVWLEAFIEGKYEKVSNTIEYVYP
ncbi:MAG: hypothetical protein OEY52_17630, partial [Gammaproteobacteria bacterium]|nr:hypothetical protein [Gammaproteobacteria bacterium]